MRQPGYYQSAARMREEPGHSMCRASRSISATQILSSARSARTAYSMGNMILAISFGRRFRFHTSGAGNVPTDASVNSGSDLYSDLAILPALLSIVPGRFAMHRPRRAL